MIKQNYLYFEKYSRKYDKTYNLFYIKWKVLHMNYILLLQFEHVIKDEDRLFSAFKKSKIEKNNRATLR